MKGEGNGLLEYLSHFYGLTTPTPSFWESGDHLGPFQTRDRGSQRSVTNSPITWLMPWLPQVLSSNSPAWAPSSHGSFLPSLIPELRMAKGQWCCPAIYSQGLSEDRQ